MSNIYIIAEAAQGYEGSVELSKLLIRSAKKAGANAIKFQVVYADDLAEEGYEYYDLFKQLEMSIEAWSEIRAYAKAQQIEFIIDIFGNQSFELAEKIKPEGIKIHSTCFFDEKLIIAILALDTYVYLSVGGIYLEEIEQLISKLELSNRENFAILYGFQAEPTPLDSNNLFRINALRERLGIQNIGFMDHSDGSGQHTVTLSAVALGLGVNLFEKHITLDRQLEMEDYTSALGVSDFARYVQSMHELHMALGTESLNLTEKEVAYRNRAIKRVVAAKHLAAGTILNDTNIRLNRPKNMQGVFKMSELVGKPLKAEVLQGHGITLEAVIHE